MNDEEYNKKHMQFGANFKLILYFAAPSQDQALGIELCQKLEAVTVMNGLKNFELNLRLSDSKLEAPQWNQAFIDQQLSPFKGEIGRIFVCGTPMMNETFDRAFEKLDLGLSSKDIEIL